MWRRQYVSWRCQSSRWNKMICLPERNLFLILIFLVSFRFVRTCWCNIFMFQRPKRERSDFQYNKQYEVPIESKNVIADRRYHGKVYKRRIQPRSSVRMYRRIRKVEYLPNESISNSPYIPCMKTRTVLDCCVHLMFQNLMLGIKHIVWGGLSVYIAEKITP